MIMIRLPRRNWGKVWRAMIEIAPVRLVASDPIYEVAPEHLELLDSLGLTYELVPARLEVNMEQSLGRGVESGRVKS
jgi:hypothetical protein